MLDACTAWLVHVRLYISLDTLPPYPLPTLPFTLCQFVTFFLPSPLPPHLLLPITIHLSFLLSTPLPFSLPHPPPLFPFPSPPFPFLLLPSPSPLLPSLPPTSLPLPPPPLSPPFPPPSTFPSPSSLPLPLPSFPLPPPPYSPFLSQVKRLKLSMQHHETQFIHDTRKKEREYNRLKERLGQVMMMG